VTRNFGEKRLTDAGFLEVAKDFDVVWIDCLLYKLTVHNFPSYPVKIISLYFPGRTFEASFQTVTSYSRCMRVGMAQDGQFFPVLLYLYGNDMPSLSHYFELAFYMDDTAITTTYRKLTLLVSYLEAYISDLERWLREQRIAINVSKSTTKYFARAGQRIL